jgi:hypothetical protein
MDDRNMFHYQSYHERAIVRPVNQPQEDLEMTIIAIICLGLLLGVAATDVGILNRPLQRR